MASFASVRHHGWHTQCRLDQKASENNCQLRFHRSYLDQKKSVKTMASLASVHRHEWQTQAAWTKKVSENNCQLRFQGSCLDKKKSVKTMASFASTETAWTNFSLLIRVCHFFKFHF